MKAFFQRIIDSIASFSFYQHLVSFPLTRTIKFYLVFLFLISLLRSLPFQISTLPQIIRNADSTLQELQANYPDDLTFTWSGSQLSSSLSPLTVPYSSALQADIETDTEFLAFVDTTSEPTNPNPDALITVGSTEVFIPRLEDTQDRIALNTIFTEPFTFSKANFTELVNHWQNIKNQFAISIGIGTPLFLFIFLLLQRTIMAVMEGALFYMFKRILGSNWHFSTSIQYALHFFIPAEIIDFVAQVIYPRSDFSFFSLTVWLYFFAITFYPGIRRWQSLQRN